MACHASLLEILMQQQPWQKLDSVLSLSMMRSTVLSLNCASSAEQIVSL